MPITSVCSYAGRRNAASAISSLISSSFGWPNAVELKNIFCTLVFQAASVPDWQISTPGTAASRLTLGAIQLLRMKKFVFVLAMIGFSAFIKADAQNECLDEVSYQTSAVGNGTETMPMSLRFIIKSDSIVVTTPSGKRSLLDVSFLIKSKTCNWNEHRTEGESKYQLMLHKEGVAIYPTMTISFKGRLRTILLQYDASEPRIFDIVQWHGCA